MMTHNGSESHQRPALAVAGARKRFGATEALRGVDLSLARGELLGLLGPNGAGKTTLVRAIAGRVRLDAGSLELLGEDLDGHAVATVRRRLGVVPQEIAVYPKLTAAENLRVFAELHGVERSALADRVGWALDWTGLGERAGELAATFSGGMKRRLNLACGVLHRPEVVLLDEPTVGVDPQSRERIWSMLEALRADGAALVLTTHQLDEAEKVCDRIAVIDHGAVVAAGSLGELIAATVGRDRHIRLELAEPLDGAHLPAALEATDGGRQLLGQVADLGVELPPMLAAVAAAGGVVEAVHSSSPSLHAVFLHLTGKELRE